MKPILIPVLILLSSLSMARAEEPVTYTEVQLQEYAGSYGQRTVVVREGKLYIGLGPEAHIPMAPTSKKDVFILPQMGNQEVTFTRDENGKVNSLRKPGQSGEMTTVNKS